MGAFGTVNLAEVNDASNTRDFSIDTSFEPYRREAFRHRSIPAQRESINLTNTSGEGTINTEGLWRREQIAWSMGAGQLYLDRKGSQEDRFYKSKGVDIFSFPYQATLLPDTHKVDASMSPSANILMSRCNDHVFVADTSAVVYYNSSWSPTSCTFGSTYGGIAPGHIYSITTNDSYCFIGTDTGIWFIIGDGSSSAFELYATVDSYPFAAYAMVRWVNDQLIASSQSRLYAFQPRTASSYPIFGAVPSVGDTNVPIGQILSVSGSGSAQCTTNKPHNLSVGQPFTIANTSIESYIDAGSSPGFSGTTLTLASLQQHGFNIGDRVKVSLQFGNGGVRTETITVTNVPSTLQFSYVPQKVGPPIWATGLTSGTANGDENGEYNADWVVASIVSDITFDFVVPTNFAFMANGGSVSTSTPPDLLFQHENPNWIWSDATDGETQIYFAGYVLSSSTSFFQTTPGYGYNGCIYRSDLLGSSTATATGVATITNSIVAQPFALDVPIQALPMSPDEYPTCIKSYLNYIFVGTNRGIRMCQTLSIYDPTATATGDLKSGPISPNILQPVTSPVTAIIGDGRYVWFAWADYDGSSTGLGKLDLSTNIDGDPLAPAYASDLMVSGQGVINSLDWDPLNNVPILCVASKGVYAPYATNEGGNLIVSQYVPSGTVESSIFDYGITDPKVPVFFDYSADAPAGTTVACAFSVDGVGQTPPADFTNGDPIEVPTVNTSGQEFQVTMTLATTNTAISPVLKRWTLRAWPQIVSGTNIMMVIKNFQVDQTDGIETYTDPYNNFIWLESRRQSQTLMTYTEGPLSVMCVISLMDWLPHKARDTYENGFIGDIVCTLTTLADYVYTPSATS